MSRRDTASPVFSTEASDGRLARRFDRPSQPASANRLRQHGHSLSWRSLLRLAIRRFPIPDHMAPQDRFVGRRGPPDSPGVHAVVEEHDQGGAPVAANGMRGVPAPRASHFVGGEVEGVDLGLGQVVSAGDVARSLGRGTAATCRSASVPRPSRVWRGGARGPCWPCGPDSPPHP